MIVAAHQTMLAPQGAPLGSVAFSGEDYSNLYNETNATPSESYTFSAWVKTSSSPIGGSFFKYGSDHRIPNQDGSGAGVGFGNTNFTTTNTGNKLIVLVEAVNWYVGSSITNLTEWNHYVFTVNNRNLAVYKNGQALYSTTSNNFYRRGSAFICIGGFSGASSGRYLACRMTRCAMWNRALSASEVAQDYADGKNAPTTTSGLQHFWPMSSATNYLADAVGSATLTAGVGGVTISTDTPFA